MKGSKVQNQGGLLLIDIKKAFDSVDRVRLMHLLLYKYNLLEDPEMFELAKFVL